MESMPRMLILLLALIAQRARSEKFECDFGDNCLLSYQCGHTTDSRGGKWSYSSTSSSVLGTTGPKRDHSGSGCYAYTKSGFLSPEPVRRLITPPINKSEGLGCVRLFYYMYGADVGTLNVYIQEFQLGEQLIWNVSGNQGESWQKMEQDLHFQNDSVPTVRLIIEVLTLNTSRSDVQGDIAIDDILFTTDSKCDAIPDKSSVVLTAAPVPLQTSEPTLSAVSTEKPEAGNYSCTFGTDCLMADYCGLRTPQGSQKWQTTATRTTALASTGPLSDHTTGKGCYVYANSRDRPLGSKYILESPWIETKPTVNVGCVSFYYHMLGDDVGTIRLYLSEKSSTDDEKNAVKSLMWSRSGNQGSKWNKLEKNWIASKENTSSIQVVFEVIMPNKSGSGVNGDIALDDIFVSTIGPCSNPFDNGTDFFLTSTSSTTLLPQSTADTTSTRPDSRNYSCTFGTDCLMADYCGLRTPQDSQKWQTTATRTTALASTGPLSDHTSGKGCFVYANSRDRPSGSKYILESPWIYMNPEVNDGCVSFYYHMLGDDVGTLRLYLAEKSASDDERNTEKRLIWSRSGNQGSSWNKLEKNWNATKRNTNSIQVVFEVIMPNKSGSGVNGDVALDDVFVSTSGPCGDPSDNGSDYFVTSTLITTMSPQAIAATTTSTAPETGNYSCTFGTDCLMADYCGLRTPQGSQKWQTTATRTTALASTGPLSDHTTGKGCFVYANSRDRPSGSKFILESPWINMKSDGNVGCVSFYYHMLGDDVGTLRLYLAEKSAADNEINAVKRLIWSRSGNQGSNWNKLEKNWNVTKTNTSSIQIVFDVAMANKSGSGVNGDIALDDVFVSTIGPCGDPTDNGTDNFLTSTLRTTLRPQVITSTISVVPKESAMTNFSCSFGTECLLKSFCGFEAPRESPKWMASAVKVTLLPTGPAADRTTGKGCFLYANSRNLPVSSNYVLHSPWIERTPSSQSGCVSFYYHMNGNDVRTLQVYLTESPKATARALVWSRSGDQGSEWKKLEKSIYFSDNSTSAVRLTFEVIMPNITGSSVTGDVALDDVFVTTTGQCSNPYDNGTDNVVTRTSTSLPTTAARVTPSPTALTTKAPGWRRNFTCDLGNDCFVPSSTCGLSSPAGSPRWSSASILQGQLRPTGPLSDHSGKGCFIYANSRSARPQSKFVLQTPWIERTPGSPVGCARFFYHMFGEDIGTLNLIVESASDSIPTPVWSRSGNQGNTWYRLEKNLNLSHLNDTSDIRLVFEVTMLDATGLNALGDIALDDFYISTVGPCADPEESGQDNFQTRTTASRPINTPVISAANIIATTSASQPPENFTCDFGSGCFTKDRWCGFAMPSGSPSWECSTSTIGTLLTTGPKGDHTGKGNYVFASPRSSSIPNAKFTLHSPWIANPSGPSTGCISLYYHMHGSDVGTLNVYIQESYNSTFLIWTASGDQGSEWTRMERSVEFRSSADTGMYRIVLEAVMTSVTGSRAEGAIAIDDIYISARYKCLSPTADVTNPTRPTTLTTATILSSINPSVTADLWSDKSQKNFTCDFGSECFTKNFCGFNLTAGDKPWACETKRPVALVNIGPTKDSRGTGAFLYADTRNGPPASRYVLVSPWISVPQGTSSSGCISLYYYMQGAYVGAIDVSLSSAAGEITRLWKAFGSQGNQWQRLERPLNLDRVSGVKDFRVLVEATISNATRKDTASGIFAIDDVQISAVHPCTSATDEMVTAKDDAEKPTAPATASLPTSATPLMEELPKNFTCDFGRACLSNDFCGLDQDSTWIKGPLDKFTRHPLLPSSDNTDGKGCYIHVKLDTQQQSGVHVLSSPWMSVLPSAGQVDIHLSYYLSGDKSNNIRIYLLNSTSKNKIFLHSSLGLTNTSWQSVNVSFDTCGKQLDAFKVVIEAITDSGGKNATNNVVAIDDLLISPSGYCESFAQTTAWPSATSTAGPQCSSNCRNGGKCVGSRCQCLDGYFGDFCGQVEIPVKGRIIIDLDYGLISNTKEAFDAFWNAVQKSMIEVSHGTQSANHNLRNVTVFNITEGSIIVSFTAILLVDSAQLPVASGFPSDVLKAVFSNAKEIKQTLLKQLRVASSDATENITRALESIEQLTILSAALQEDREMCAPACHETASCRRQVNEYHCTCKEGLIQSSHDGPCVSSIRQYSEKGLSDLEIGLIAGACALLLIVVVMIAVIRRCVSRPGATTKGADSSNGISATSDGGNSIANSHKAIVEMQTVNDESPIKTVPGNSSNRTLVTNVMHRADGSSGQYARHGANNSVPNNANIEKPTASEPTAQPKQVPPTTRIYTTPLVTDNSSVEGDNFGSSETICTEL